MEPVPDAMVGIDVDDIILVNGQAESLFGQPRGELLGRPISTLIPELFHDDRATNVDGVLKDSKARSMSGGRETLATRYDGPNFPVEIRMSPLTTSEGTIVAASIRDVTGRKEREQLTTEARVRENELKHLKGLDAFRTRLMVHDSFAKTGEKTVKILIAGGE
jgi:PAS domain S-box-containing protein